jgi:3-methyladenine DNA glycosylase AlkD
VLTADNLQAELDQLGDPSDAQFLQGYFKTAAGQYGEGDVFLGVRVPVTRKIAAKYRAMPLTEVEKLLESPIHEHRLAAVIIMTEKAKRANPAQYKALYNLYLKRTDCLNNWDIVDLSCRDIIGGYLIDKPRDPLYKLAQSQNMWERRIAMVSTWQFIRARDLDDTFKIAAMLLNDKQDLIHKAVGWMLRSAGQRDLAALKHFLNQYAASMPRTALRYSLERMHPEDKRYYMNLKNAVA